MRALRWLAPVAILAGLFYGAGQLAPKAVEAAIPPIPMMYLGGLASGGGGLLGGGNCSSSSASCVAAAITSSTNAFDCSLATGTCLMTSGTNATTANTTVPVFTLRQTFVDLAANDLVFGVQDRTGANIFKVDFEGDTTVGTILPSVTNTKNIGLTTQMWSEIYVRDWRDASNIVRFQARDGLASNIIGTLPAASATSTAGAVVISSSIALDSGDAILEVENAAAAQVFRVDYDGALTSASTKTRGTITMSGGTGTATVLSGAICVCQNTTTAGTVKCAVATTTLTADKGTAGDTDVIAYHCL